MTDSQAGLRPKIWRMLCFAGFIGAMPISSTAVAQELAAARASAAIASCRTDKSHADTSDCYDKVLKQLRGEVRAAQSKRMKEFKALSAKDYGGNRNLRRFRSAGRDADRQWKALIATECGPLIEAKFYGGQGRGLFAQLCEINLLAARLDAATAANR